MTDTRYHLVFVTAANAGEATRIGRTLVEERLAACANVLESCRSVYRWKGEIVEEGEAMLLAKTRREDFDAVARRVTELHGYEVPEIIAVALEAVSEAYGKFLSDVFKG
jgi:periplasmic divalent cation tolerance protein